MTKIDATINQKINNIIAEQNLVILERDEVIRGFWTARIANLHIVMLGPGGTGKSFLSRNCQERIDGAKLFETALDETTDPSRVFGPVDVKALAELGKARVVTTGMLPEATDAFIDEIMNANGPVKHSLQPILNERLFHNNGIPHKVPLRTMVAGTNVNNADTDPSLAPFFDRLHIRFTVNYLGARNSQADMVAQAIARMATVGRGAATMLAGAQTTTITLDELDQASAEALNLDVDAATMDMFLDIREELGSNGILISDRRMVEGMAAVLANAWIRNHDTVQIGDLDVLASMWWSLQEHESTARGVILAAPNPSEQAALDLLDQLDELKAEVAAADKDSSMDESRKQKLGVQSVKNANKLVQEATQFRSQAVAKGVSTQRLDEVLAKADAFKVEVGQRLFGLDAASMGALAKS